MPEPQFPAVAGATGAAIRHHDPQPRATRSVAVLRVGKSSLSPPRIVRVTLPREPWAQEDTADG